MAKIFKSKWFWIAAAILAVAAILQWGGKTIVISNASIDDICQVHVSMANDTTNWGPNRLVGKIVYPNSYDLRLPLYFRWFKASTGSTFYMWAVDCNGKVINTTQFDEKDGGFITWQVSRIYK